MKNNSRQDPSLLKTTTQEERNRLSDLLRSGIQRAKSQRELDEAAQRLNEAEQKFLVANGWVPVLEGERTNWRAVNGDLVEQEVAVASQKRWSEVGWSPEGPN